MTKKILTLLICWTAAAGMAAGQCSLFCSDTVRVALSAATCQAIVNPEMVLILPGSCPFPKKIELRDTAGIPLPTNPVITAPYKGMPLTARVTDVISGNSCEAVVIAFDKTAPMLNCRDTTFYCNENSDPAYTGYPQVLDNCGDKVTLSYTDQRSEYPCNNPYTLIITRTWTASDADGNSATSQQRIYYKRITLADIRFPANLDNYDQPAISCDAGTAPATTGSPSAFGNPVVNVCSFSTHYQDQIITNCGGSFTLLRIWTVQETCSGNYVTKVQVIKGIDNTPPVLTCPKDTAILADAALCSGSMTIPAPAVTDNCSKWRWEAAVDAPATYDPKTRLAGNLLAGDNTVRYQATDSCGNSASCAMTVRVKDATPPSARCNPFLQVAVDQRGNATRQAVVLDNGSFDNCGFVTEYKVRRLAGKCQPAGDYANEVSFDCCDVGDTVNVMLQVKDVFGNPSACITSVIVTDDINPRITCPKDLTLSCGQDYNNTDITGLATATDNCTPVVSFKDVAGLNPCGAGLIKRNWQGRDKQGRTASCTQQIYVRYDRRFTVNKNNPQDPTDDVRWPADYETTGCGAATQPETSGKPAILLPKEACAKLDITYNDQVFPIQAPACYKIERKWKIVDACQFNATTGDGVWEYVQTIRVSNFQPPVFRNCSDTVVCASAPGYVPVTFQLRSTATDDCTPAPLLRWNYQLDLDNDGTVDATGAKNNLTGNFAFGDHSIAWTVEDGCGNVTTCRQRITVKDCQAPVVTCLPDLTVNLERQTDGSISAAVTPAQLSSGATDNCTPSGQIRLDVFPAQFSCGQLGPQTVTLQATDLVGNTATCSTTVTVRDMNRICLKTGASITGTIKTDAGDPVEGVSVSLGNGMPASMTGPDGQFRFPTLVTGDDYTVSPEKDTNPTNGISTYDLVLISKHILGLERLTSPFRLLAADANRSGTITTYDMIEIRKLLLRVSDRYPSNTSWRFVDKNYQFDPANPLAGAIPGSCTLKNLTGPAQADFIAVKVGDVSGNAAPNSLFETEDRSAGDPLPVEVADAALEPGQEYDLHFRIPELVNPRGFQLALQWDPEKTEIVSAPSSPLPDWSDANAGMSQRSKGRIFISWNSENTENKAPGEIFTVRLRALQKTLVSKTLSITEKCMKPECYTEDLHIRPLVLKFTPESGTTLEPEKTILYQNVPNPFANETTIGFRLAETTPVSLTITDAAGRKIWYQNGVYQEGYHEVILQKSDLPGTGLFFFQMQTPRGKWVRKMIKHD